LPPIHFVAINSTGSGTFSTFNIDAADAAKDAISIKFEEFNKAKSGIFCS